MVRKFTIKEYRIFKSVLQNDICFHIGLSQSAYSQIENGFKKTSINNYEKIANYLGVPLESVLKNQIEVTYFVFNSLEELNNINNLEIQIAIDNIFELMRKIQLLQNKI